MEGTPFGRYRLVELLGRGGMGEVWRAYDTETNRVVALKVLLKHLASDEAFQQRFRREANAAAGLNDPHIVPIHHFGEIDGSLYVDMRLIDGHDLETRLTRSGRLDPALAVSVIEQAGSALDVAHRVGLVHRDVKPSNIFVTPSDFAYLIDFGIARAAGDTRITSTGSTFGTFAYMAPERFGTGEADRRSDIYALTCVLYECLTGQRPYPGNSLEQQVAGHLNTPPPKPSDGGVAPAFDEVIARGLAKDPAQRFETSSELAAAARDALVPASQVTVRAPRSVSTLAAPVAERPADEDAPPSRLAGLLLIAAGVIGALPAVFFAVWGVLAAAELG